jgi:hypothetical protein
MMNFPMDKAWYMHGYGWYTEAQVESSCKQYGWRKEKDTVIGVEGLPIGWRKGCKPENYTHVSFPISNPYHTRAR